MSATGGLLCDQLMTSDAPNAARYHGAVVGWKIADCSDPPCGAWVVGAHLQGAAFGAVGPQGVQA